MNDSEYDNLRVPPHDLLAEQSTLGGMLISKDAVADVLQSTISSDFYIPKHEIIFSTIRDLYADGSPTDVIAVTNALTKSGNLQKAGGADYLHELAGSVPTAANADYYAHIVSERAVLRRLVAAGTRIAQIGYAAEGDVADIVNQAQSEIYSVASGKLTEDYVSLSSAIMSAHNEMETAHNKSDTLTGVPTGFADLDSLTNGLHAGQLIIIAARPGIGKSTLALDFARHVSIDHNMTALLFSLEMHRTEIAMRLLSAESGVRLQQMRTGKLGDNDWVRIARTQARVADAPLYIDDSANMSLIDIRAKCRRLKQTADLKLVIVDYLQLMSSGKKVESRQQEVAEFSRSLKLLAKELNIPVIALSQLNRNSEQRSDKRPVLSDLRESGSLEQDADMVILLHRDAAYDKDNSQPDADFIIAKHRNGPTDVIKTLFQGHLSRFVDLAPNYMQNMP